MSETLIIALVSTVLGSSTIVGFVLHRKALRRLKLAEARKSEADADKAHWERYEKQLDHANSTIGLLHKQIENDAERMSKLNATIDSKVDRIRELTDKLIDSERTLNVANEKITRLTEERDTERLMKEKYKEWHCRSSICEPDHPDPKGRRPPNPNLKGKQYQ